MIVLNYNFPFSGTIANIWVYSNLFAGIEFDSDPDFDSVYDNVRQPAALP